MRQMWREAAGDRAEGKSQEGRRCRSGTGQDRAEGCPGCGTDQVLPAAGRRAGPGVPWGRTGGSAVGCPGPGSGPSQRSEQALRRGRGGKGHAHLFLLQFVGHLGPSGPGLAPAAPLRLRLCSAALGPLGVPPPPPARCARVERRRRRPLAQTLAKLPDNQAPPPWIGHQGQAASFFFSLERKSTNRQGSASRIGRRGRARPKMGRD